ncbi:MAG: chemotaxis protein CheA [Desulfovibrionaceae bacterium]
MNEMNEEILAEFIVEAKEHIESVEPNIVTLESNPEKTEEILNAIFRSVHSLKGASGFLNLSKINGITHVAESIMDDVRKGKYQMTPPITDVILEVTDILQEIILSLENTGEEGDIHIEEVMKNMEYILLNQGDMKGNSEEKKEIKKNVSQEDIEKTEKSDNSIEHALIEKIINTLEKALHMFENGPEEQENVDNLYESLSLMKESAHDSSWEEIYELCKRTMGIVSQGKEKEGNFSLLSSILGQEIEIIIDLSRKEILSTVEEIEDTNSVHFLPSQEIVFSVEEVEDEESMAIIRSVHMQKNMEKNLEISNSGADATKSGKKSIKQEKNKSSFIRVEYEKLDHLMNLIGELIITRNRYALLTRSLGDTNNKSEDVIQNLLETTYSMARISDDLQDTIMNVRMMSLSNTFSRLPRLVRDIAKKSNKEVLFTMEGEDTELDKTMVEAIGDPLVHLIRNAVDHGIETAQERISKNKTAEGNVSIAAYRKGNSVVIEIKDDGKGMNPDVLKRVAIAKDLLSEEDVKNLTHEQALELIFLPGFSSASEVTDISGRGVGMDVVKTNIKNLKGTVEITSVEGEGSVFTLSFPLTLAIIDSLMVKVEGETFAIPLDTVLETTKISKDILNIVDKQKTIILRGEIIYLISLAERLNLIKEKELPEMISTVIIKVNNRRVGLIVDSLLERQEVVIKSLGSYLGDVEGISGATIVGDGSVVLILDPYELCSVSSKSA